MATQLESESYGAKISNFPSPVQFLACQSAPILTLSGLIVNTDSLGLIVSVIILYTHKMRVCLLIEAGTSCQNMFIGLVHGFHHLQSKKRVNFLILTKMVLWGFFCFLFLVWHSTTPLSQRQKTIVKTQSPLRGKKSTYIKIPCIVYR